jgi:hypothetical protein
MDAGALNGVAAGRKGWFLKPGMAEIPRGRAWKRARRVWNGARLAAVLGHGRALGARASVELAHWTNTALATASFGGEIQDWFIDKFASGAATGYDKAMDAVYNSTHLGGGLHRLFDGGHDVIGAWNACGEAAGACGDTLGQQVAGYLAALWKDCVTPMGLPLTTCDKGAFDEVAGFLSHFGVEKVWLAKMAGINALDLIGGATGILGVLLSWNVYDAERFAEMVGNFGISAIASANPLLGLVALVCLARAYQRARMDADGAGARPLLVAMGKGGVGSAVVLGCMSLVSGPAWIALVVGICASVLAGRAFDLGRKRIGQQDWGALAAFVTNSLRSAKLAPA